MGEREFEHLRRIEDINSVASAWRVAGGTFYKVQLRRKLVWDLSHVLSCRAFHHCFELVIIIFCFAATTGAVKSHHFDMAFAAFIEDDATREFLIAANRFGYDELIEKFNEARTRGFWTPRSNSAYAYLEDEK